MSAAMKRALRRIEEERFYRERWPEYPHANDQYIEGLEYALEVIREEASRVAKETEEAV